jgi:hypothetical protein
VLGASVEVLGWLLLRHTAEATFIVVASGRWWSLWLRRGSTFWVPGQGGRV